MKAFKGITALAFAAVTAGSLGLSTVAQTVSNAEISETVGIESGAENIKAVYKAMYPEQSNMIDEIVDRLSADEEFIYIYDHEGLEAFQIIEDTLRDSLNPAAVPAGWDGEDFYYADHYIPPIDQIEKNFCGVACIIMALIGGGKMSRFDYTTDMLYKYAADLGVYDEKNKKPVRDDNGDLVGVHINDMKNFLQERFPTDFLGGTYKSKAFNRYSINNIDRYLMVALDSDTVPIIRVNNPRKLNYYPNNYNGMHYIIVESIDFATGEVGVIDPHYSPNYFGTHYITLDELKSLPDDQSDLWMCIYTTKSDDPYIHN